MAERRGLQAARYRAKLQHGEILAGRLSEHAGADLGRRPRSRLSDVAPATTWALVTTRPCSASIDDAGAAAGLGRPGSPFASRAGPRVLMLTVAASVLVDDLARR